MLGLGTKARGSKAVRMLSWLISAFLSVLASFSCTEDRILHMVVALAAASSELMYSHLFDQRGRGPSLLAGV